MYRQNQRKRFRVWPAIYVLAWMTAVTAISLASTAPNDLLEIGKAKELLPADPAPQVIKIVSYNIHYKNGNKLKELVYLLKHDRSIGKAAILGLQELDRNKKRTGFKNVAQSIADELGYYYAWAAPPNHDDDSDREDPTGVAIFSQYPLKEVTRIVLPHEGPRGRRRVALGATINIGDIAIRFYSVHAELRLANSKRIEHLGAVLEDIARFGSIDRAVILGDLNTVGNEAVQKSYRLFGEAKFSTPFSESETTWKFMFLDYKLDHIWLRNMEALDCGIGRTIKLSDHFPLWADVRIGTRNLSATKN